MLKYGSAKVKFTASATYRLTLELQAAPAVKAVVRKARHHSADAATKEAANVVVSAEAVTEEVETRVAAIAEAVAHRVLTTSVAVETVREDQIARVAVVVTVQAVVEIARVDQEDNNRIIKVGIDIV